MDTMTNTLFITLMMVMLVPSVLGALWQVRLAMDFGAIV